MILGALVTLVASGLVRSTYARYSKVGSQNNISGAMAAERILHGAGIYDVTITHVAGHLTDHYNPKTKVLALSDTVYQSTSVAAIGVAAHECGHAIQHGKAYRPLVLRSAMVPTVSVCSKLSWPIILIGVLFSWNQTLITIGIVFFAIGVLFALVTLPVEFNASNRAIAVLRENRILNPEEIKKAGKVLNAAAMTYVASAAAMILQLLRLVLLFGGNRRDD